MNFEQKASTQRRPAKAEGDREDRGCFEGF